MRLIRVLVAFGLTLGTLAFGAAAPVAAGDPCFHEMARPPVTEGTATVVTLDDCAFVPTIAHVPVGTEIRFINSDQVGHEVVGANLAWGHHDKILADPPAAEPAAAPTSSVAPSLLPAVLALGIVAAVIVLGASMAIRRRRSGSVRPTA